MGQVTVSDGVQTRVREFGCVYCPCSRLWRRWIELVPRCVELLIFAAHSNPLMRSQASQMTADSTRPIASREIFARTPEVDFVADSGPEECLAEIAYALVALRSIVQNAGVKLG